VIALGLPAYEQKFLVRPACDIMDGTTVCMPRKAVRDS
jgi:hypothetical protein